MCRCSLVQSQAEHLHNKFFCWSSKFAYICIDINIYSRLHFIFNLYAISQFWKKTKEEFVSFLQSHKHHCSRAWVQSCVLEKALKLRLRFSFSKIFGYSKTLDGLFAEYVYFLDHCGFTRIELTPQNWNVFILLVFCTYQVEKNRKKLCSLQL